MEEPLECCARPVVSMAEMQQRGGEFAIVPAGSALSEAFYMQAASAAAEISAAADRAAAERAAAERAASAERVLAERERADRIERASAVDRIERASAAERSEFRFMVGAAATCTAAAVVGVAAVVVRTQP